MATIATTLIQKVVWKSLLTALFVLTLRGPASAHAASGTSLPIVGPQALPPQGRLTVYSERYVMVDADAPMFYRRPVKLYTLAGQLLGTYKNPVGDGPILITIPPGHYLVVSESHWTQREVQADVEDQQDTVVPEGLLEQAPLFSSSSSR